MQENGKQFLHGSVEAILFCGAILVLVVITRQALADGPGGGSLCVSESPGKCSYDCCNRCQLIRPYPNQAGFLCGGFCYFSSISGDPCEKCEAGCDQEIIDYEGEDVCPCGEL